MSGGKGISKEIISSFEHRNDFIKLLEVNPGLVVVKLGATWCGPCKKIAPIVEAFFASSPKNVVCADIDVDESVDLYAFLKAKKRRGRKRIATKTNFYSYIEIFFIKVNCISKIVSWQTTNTSWKT